ncbi:MAG TPA: hypothetical protein VND93_02105 [Myxococcales bacterium]|jgi:hypothetical protein|nr:hypothetical protein [Myxococcales bacterium]
MPHELTTFQLPGGARCARVEWRGVVTGEDAGAMARREGGPAWMAIVQTNPVARVAANFITRMSGDTRRRLCSTEAEAIRWLDERVREGAAKERAGEP